MWQGFRSGGVDRLLWAAKQECLWRQFPELKRDPNEPSLQLANYLLVEPQKYYSRDAYREVRDWLMLCIRKPSGDFLNLLFHDTDRIDHAIREMREINRDPRHYEATPSSDVNLQQLCRDFALPGYFNLTEGVYSDLVEPISAAMTVKRGKNPDGIMNHIYNATTSPSFASAMPATAAAFDSVVRNAIAHGGVRFAGPSVTFTDTKKSIEVLLGSVIRLFDYTVDVCNALILAYSVALIANREALSSIGYRLPDELLIGEIIARTTTRAWSVTGCEKAAAIDNQSQLVVKVQDAVRAQIDFMFSLHKTAAWTQALLPGYARYLVQTSSPAGTLSGLYSFSGPRLDDANNGFQDSPTPYADVIIQESCLPFVRHRDWPTPIHRVWLMREAVRSQLARAHLLHYSEPKSILLVIRNARAKRDHSTVRLWGWGAPSFERSHDEVTTMVASQPEHVLGRLSRAALHVACPRLAVTVVPKYVCLDLFSRDLRIRELEASHLRPELVCQLEWADSGTLLPKVTLMGGRVERHGHVRITWNSHPVPYDKESWFC